MAPTLNTAVVIDSLNHLETELSNLRKKSFENEKLHKSNRHYSFMHYWKGCAHAYSKSFHLLNHLRDRLLIEK